MVTAKRGPLNDVLLGNNPHPTNKTGWSNRSKREFDLVTWDYGQDGWSLACNQDRVVPGTVGWIHRADGSFGHLAGLIVFDDTFYSVKEPGGTVHYCNGRLWRLPREWWIDGARIGANAAWSGRAPFGTTRRFTNGEQLKPADRKILFTLLHPVAQAWLDQTIISARNPGSGIAGP